PPHTSVHPQQRPTPGPVSLRTVLENPSRYEVMRLDGGKVETMRGMSGGVFLVRDKTAAGSARVMTVLRP
ncbi:MAG TPA: hypothetical protein VKZ88_05945, partial [Fibrobacteria bacterium]|nr:hypothetical protein [Fibrobacteria bacterium]